MLKGYATYQRTSLSMISVGTWAPLKLMGVVSPSRSRVNHRRTSYLKSAVNGNRDTTPETATATRGEAGHYPAAETVF